MLKANKKIVESLDSIHVKPLRIYNDGNAVIAELKIDINNGKEILSVVDIIQFTDEGLIARIKAFKG